MSKYPDTKGWTYGAELEFADIKQSKGLPEGFGWDKRDVTMVNSNGIAVDPKGISYKRGGEINTPPTKTIKGQVAKFNEILEWFPEAAVNYRSNLHVHIRVPGLSSDLNSCKRIQRYIASDPGYLDVVEPIPKPEPDQYPSQEEYDGAMRRYKRRLVSHHKTLPKNAFTRQQKATTMEEFFDAEAPFKDGKPMHHLAPRCAVNLRQMKETDTIEFRHFPLTLDPDKFQACLRWCRDFLFAALNGGEKPTDLFKNGDYDIPTFPEYVHWMEIGYRLTVHDGTVKREKIEDNIAKIRDGTIDLKAMAAPPTWKLRESKRKGDSQVVINVRGTSGSGKSTLVFNLLSNYKSRAVMDSTGKRVGYVVPDMNLFIVGSYETATGGCDGIKTVDMVMFRVLRAYELGYSVLFEGLLISGINSKLIELSKKVNMVAFTLNTPLEVCLKRVTKRRAKAGNTAELNPRNTEQKFKAVLSSRKALKEAGVRVITCTNDRAYYKIATRLLGGEEPAPFNPNPPTSTGEPN